MSRSISCPLSSQAAHLQVLIYNMSAKMGQSPAPALPDGGAPTRLSFEGRRAMALSLLGWREALEHQRQILIQPWAKLVALAEAKTELGPGVGSSFGLLGKKHLTAAIQKLFEEFPEIKRINNVQQ